MRGIKLSALAWCIASISAFAQEQGAAEQDESRKSPLEVRTMQLLQADPKEILRARELMQRQSAAKQAPILEDFADEIPQDILDLEEMFEVTLQPDQIAPKVFLARYQSTAISFVDAYGNPWPIRKISNFLKGYVEIERAVSESDGEPLDNKDAEGGKGSANNGISLDDPQAGSLTMTALKHGVVGNITVYLYGLQTPISINLQGKAGMYHRIATMKVSDVGPQTDAHKIFQEKSVTIGTKNDADLNNALYGVSPVGSETMVVQGAEGKAWLKGDHLYLQTPLSVFSPDIIRTSHGNGRFRAYKLPKTTTVMATNNEGNTVTIKILRHPSTDIDEQTFIGGRRN